MPTLVRGIDVSSHQASDLRTLIGQHRPAHVVVKLYLPVENVSGDYSRAQITSAKAAGCTVGGYVWCYGSEDPRKTVRDAIGLARSAGVELPVLWLDCESYTVGGEVRDPGPDAAWLRAAIDESRELGVKPGIYTGGWWWRERMNNSREFADLPLWAADYNGNADIEDVRLFGGWTHASAKQFAEKLPSGAGLDQDVFSIEVAVNGPSTIIPIRPTLADLEQVSPGIGRQMLEWQRLRYARGQNPNDYPACRAHLRAIGVRDPGPDEPIGFRRPTLEEIQATNPNIRQQVAEWQQARRRAGEDPNDYAACRRHIRALGAADPGTSEYLGFFSEREAVGRG
jgi:hypothetical protein